MHTTVLLGCGSANSQPDEWQVTSASWAHLTVKKHERRVKDKPCLDWKSEGHNSDRWTTFQSRRKTKAQMRNTHNAADSRLRCPEPRSRAIIVQMFYFTTTAYENNFQQKRNQSTRILEPSTGGECSSPDPQVCGYFPKSGFKKKSMLSVEWHSSNCNWLSCA